MHCIGSAEHENFAVVYHPNNRVETQFCACMHFCAAYPRANGKCCVCARQRHDRCTICAVLGRGKS